MGWLICVATQPHRQAVPWRVPAEGLTLLGCQEHPKRSLSLPPQHGLQARAAGTPQPSSGHAALGLDRKFKDQEPPALFFSQGATGVVSEAALTLSWQICWGVCVPTSGPGTVELFCTSLCSSLLETTKVRPALELFHGQYWFSVTITNGEDYCSACVRVVSW